MSRLLDAFIAGSVTVTTSAQQVYSAPMACFDILLQADPDNIVDIFLGDATNQPIQLAPGQTVGLETNNPGALYAKTPSGTAIFAYLIRTNA